MPDLTVTIPDSKVTILLAAINEADAADPAAVITAWLTAQARTLIWSEERAVASTAAANTVPDPIP